MAISYVGAAATTAGGVTATTSSGAVNLPGSLAANDLLIVAVSRGNDYALTSATPSGYTFLRNILDVNTTPAGCNTDIYYRICSGSEGATGPTFTVGSATRWAVQAAAYRGVNTSTPFVVENGQVEAGASTTTHAAPSVNNTDAAAWAVFHAATRGSASPQTWTPPTGLTERLDTDAGAANTSNCWAEWADSNGVVATGSVAYSATASSASAAATMWAAFLKPLVTFGSPTGLAATAISTTAIDVTWNSVVGATGYDIKRGTTNVEASATVIASDFAGTTYHSTGLTPGTQYYFWVRAVA